MFDFFVIKLFRILSLTVSHVYAQAEQAVTTAAASAPQQPPAWMQFVPFAVIIVVFYFFLIRPQAKKQKEQAQFLQALKAGDLVITQSGIFGKISSLNDQIVNLEIAQGVQIKILRSQVTMQQSALQKAPESK